MSKLQIEYLPTDSLVPYINNPRVNDRAIDAVAGNIAEFGFKNPWEQFTGQKAVLLS